MVSLLAANHVMNLKAKNIVCLLWTLVCVQGYAAVRTTVASGDWSNTASWDCGCVPAATDDIIIASGHSINLTANVTTNHFTIQASSFLTGNRKLTVNGNFTVNGTILTTSDVILAGVGTTIDGTGSVSTTKKWLNINGNKTILSSANISYTGSQFSVDNGLTLTNNGTFYSSAKVVGGNAASTWINGASGSARVDDLFMDGAVLDASAPGNTVVVGKDGNMDVPVTVGNTFGNLTVSGTGTKKIVNNLAVIGNLDIQSGTLAFNPTNLTLTLEGNWSNSGTFDSGTSTVVLGGTNNQTLSNSLGTQQFYNLTLNKGGGTVTLMQNVNATNQLSLNNGEIDAGGYKLTLGTGIASPGTLITGSGYVKGELSRWINTPAVSYDFPVGGSDNHNVAVMFNSLTGGEVSFSFVSTFPGINGFPLEDAPDSLFNPYVEGYWESKVYNGFTSSDLNLNLDGTGFTSFTIDGSTRVLTRANAGVNWIANGSHLSPVGNVGKRNNVTVLPGHYVFADTTDCSAPVTSSISGLDSVCISVSENYSVTNTIGSTYTWNVTGGTISAGQGTATITVDWPATGGNYTVSVVEDNGCTVGSEVSKNVAVHPISPSAISGNLNVATGSVGKVYSVSAVSGYTYNWTVNGGTITAGQGTSSITVSWGAPGAGSVCVNAINGCGTSADYCINITIYNVINSVASGVFGTASTWDCSCVPTAASSVKINSGHTVTLSANRTVSNMTIATGGVMDVGTRKLTLAGSGLDIVIDGTLQGAKFLTIDGSSSLSGNGTISLTDIVDVKMGPMNILAGTNLNIATTDLNIQSNIIVNNYGTLTVGGNITAAAATSTFINRATGIVNVKNQLFTAQGVLIASEVGNTVAYNGTGAQTIKNSQGSTYHHLTLGNAATKSLPANLIINGNLTISGTAQLDITASNFTMDIYGNWVVTSTNAMPFNYRTSTVFFKGTVAQTISSGSKFYHLNINAASVKSAVSTGNIELKGNWLNTSGFSASKSTVIMSGTTAQTLTGATNFYNLTVNNTAGVATVADAIGIQGVMAAQNGTFTTNGLLYVLSNGSGTGSIGTISATADVVGNVTVQRYIAPAPTSWRFLSTPCSGRTMTEWNDDFTTAGFPGSDFPGFSFVSIASYDETKLGDKDSSISYSYPGNVTDPIVVGKGYYAYIGPVPLTFEVIGPINKFAQALPVTYTNSGLPFDDGWNLVGNPYPSTIDWDAAAGWTKTNIDNAVYVWNPSIDQFAAYVSGIGTNGGSRYIPSQQGFYVKANAAGPALAVSEAVKSSVDQQFRSPQGQEEQIIRLIVAGAGKTDETAIRFNSIGTIGFDPAIDAIKFESMSSTAPSVYTESMDMKFGINGMPLLVAARSIPVGVSVKVNGVYTLSVGDMSEFTLASCITLEDLFTGDMIDIVNTQSYSFTANIEDEPNRFILHFSKPFILSSSDATCYGIGDGSVKIEAESNNWHYRILTDTTEIFSGLSSYKEEKVEGLLAGVYQVEIQGPGMVCARIDGKVVVKEPNVVEIEAEVKAPSCAGSSDGSIVAQASGGNGNYEFTWNTGETSNEAHGLKEGYYMVSVNDGKYCKRSLFIEITDPDPIKFDYTMQINHQDICAVDLHGAATGGNGSYQFTWKSMTQDSYVNSLIGCTDDIVLVKVEDGNGCIVRDTLSLQLSEACSTLEALSLSFYPNPAMDKVNIFIDKEITGDMELVLMDMLGQRVAQINLSALNSNGVELNLTAYPRGIYEVQLRTEAGTETQKLILR